MNDQSLVRSIDNLLCSSEHLKSLLYYELSSSDLNFILDWMLRFRNVLCGETHLFRSHNLSNKEICILLFVKQKYFGDQELTKLLKLIDGYDSDEIISILAVSLLLHRKDLFVLMKDRFILSLLRCVGNDRIIEMNHTYAGAVAIEDNLKIEIEKILEGDEGTKSFLYLRPAYEMLALCELNPYQYFKHLLGQAIQPARLVSVDENYRKYFKWIYKKLTKGLDDDNTE